MPYVTDQCVCNNPSTSRGSNITQNSLPIQCKSCGKKTWDNDAKQRRITNAVRVPSSLYTMNLGALSVGNCCANPGINWNQSSDRTTPAGSTTRMPVVPKGNSTKRTTTSLKPGGLNPGGHGVDVKHNSYARRHARLRRRHKRDKVIIVEKVEIIENLVLF